MRDDRDEATDVFFVCNLYYHGGRHNYWFLAFCIIILSRKHVIIKIEAMHSEENQQFFGHKFILPWTGFEPATSQLLH